jgi:hypothetical protein
MTNFEVKDGLGFVLTTNHLKTGLPQEEAVNQIKLNAHKAGYTYRSRKLKNGEVRLTIIKKATRKEDM